MAPPTSRHEVGPENGRIEVRTYREGVAQKIGHDLVLDVGQWHATVETAEDGVPHSLAVEVDSRSLRVREGLHGVKPLTDKDRGDIVTTINEKILRGEPIAFRSTAVESNGGELTVQGELSFGTTSRAVAFTLEMTTAGQLTGSAAVTQSEWGIKPYRGLMGALKVRDTVEIAADVQLPRGPQAG